MSDGCMGDGMRAWEVSIALDSAIRVGRAIPTSRILKDGEVAVDEEKLLRLIKAAEEFREWRTYGTSRELFLRL